MVLILLPQPGLPQQPPDPNEKPKIEPLKTSITVSDTVTTEAPAAISVVDQAQIHETPGVNIDDRLRSVPGFTLFRRSSSLVANPTTQGVSLRGIGSSGASRTLVLWDGIPENDPFGGWVYWDRFSPTEMERVEISRGASTSVFGDLAMGGAIGLFSVPASRNRWSAGYEGGNRNTHEVSAGGSNLWRNFAVSAFGRAFTTDGYFIVPEGVRGRADTPATLRFVTAETRLDYFGAANRLFLRFDLLAEHRDNGTVVTKNSTGLGSLAANYAHEWRRDQLSVLGYYTQEGFRATFSSVTNSRNTDRLTYSQRVPSEAVGAASFWRHSESRWHLLAGADTQRAEGFSTDTLVPAGQRVGGGSVLQHGIFGQADFRVGPVSFFGGARHHFTGRGETFFSPSGGVAVGRGMFRARGSVYRSFRAPTLNELFRVFQVGNTTTLANAALKPETLFGAEVGLDIVGERSRASVTFYRNDLEHLITNVTLQTGATIIRQRQNATAALSRGIEANVRHTWGPWQGELSYLLADSRFFNGLRISQVPRNQGSGQLTYRHKQTFVSGAVRSYSLQFDDDLNQFKLPGFATVQLAAEQHLARGFSLNASIENLLDRQFYVGFSPTPTIGAPRLWRAGIRWEHR